MVKCKNCIFFDPFKAEGDNETDLGLCRKNAPTLFSYLHKGLSESLVEVFKKIETDTKAKTLWPIANFDDCCGEGIEKDKNELDPVIETSIYNQIGIDILIKTYNLMTYIRTFLELLNSKNIQSLLTENEFKEFNNIRVDLEDIVKLISKIFIS